MGGRQVNVPVLQNKQTQQKPRGSLWVLGLGGVGAQMLPLQHCDRNRITRNVAKEQCRFFAAWKINFTAVKTPYHEHHQQ